MSPIRVLPVALFMALVPLRLAQAPEDDPKIQQMRAELAKMESQSADTRDRAAFAQRKVARDPALMALAGRCEDSQDRQKMKERFDPTIPQKRNAIAEAKRKVDETVKKRLDGDTDWTGFKTEADKVRKDIDDIRKKMQEEIRKHEDKLRKLEDGMRKREAELRKAADIVVAEKTAQAAEEDLKDYLENSADYKKLRQDCAAAKQEYDKALEQRCKVDVDTSRLREEQEKLNLRMQELQSRIKANEKPGK